jgi:hypothetical protein
VVFSSPVLAALAGDHITADTRVIASATGDNAAAIVLMDPAWAEPDRVLCLRDDDGWIEAGSGSGRTGWSLTHEDDDLGVLVCWGDAEPGATAAVVTFRGRTIEVAATNGYFVWLVEGVPQSAMGDPVDFKWDRP